MKKIWIKIDSTYIIKLQIIVQFLRALNFRWNCVLLEQDANLLLDFVERTQQVSDVKKMMREFCLFMLEKQHLQWKPALRSAFIKIWSKLAQEEYVEVRKRLKCQ